jgi:hypothetical protein
MTQTFGYTFAIKKIKKWNIPTCHTTFSSHLMSFCNEVVFKSVKYVCNMPVPKCATVAPNLQVIKTETSEFNLDISQ